LGGRGDPKQISEEPRETCRSLIRKSSQIERGWYLTVLSDCGSCHTVPSSDQPFAGGRPIETPFGNIVAPNITPDPETGIGSWSDEQFDAAIRRGIRSDGSRLYPAMPYNAYTKMSHDDVLAIRAYLNSVTPVHNAVVADTLPFPFNIRASMRVWYALHFAEGEYRLDPGKSAEWNRGAFLVDGPGHRGACHTPKAFLGGDKTDQYGTSPLPAKPPTIAAGTGPYAASALDVDSPATAAGAAIYRDQCSACHGLDGKGVAELFASISDSSMVRSDDPTTSIRIILRDARSVGTHAQPTASGMPSYGRHLDDREVADVLTYVRSRWGGIADPIESEQVSKVRLDTALRPD
jgi:mono/diheme cytochrome c family protein